GHALRRVIGVFLRDIDSASDCVWLADTKNAAALWNRLARLNDARAGGNAVAWIDLAGHLAARAIGKHKAREADSGKSHGLDKTNSVERPEAPHRPSAPDRPTATIPRSAADGNRPCASVVNG